MPRPPPKPGTRLGAAIQAMRRGRTQQAVADEVGLGIGTVSAIERGIRSLSMDTALKLAAWLEWDVGEVIRASLEAPPSAE